MKKFNLPKPVMHRFPRYYRAFVSLKEKEIDRVSSDELAEMMNLTASQVRQDFNCMGRTGRQGYGYNVENMLKEIHTMMCGDVIRPLVVMGTGNLGRAIARNFNYETVGFDVKAVFDVRRELVGEEIIPGIFVQHEEDFADYVRKNGIPTVAMSVATTEETLNRVARIAYDLGVRSFLNVTSYEMHLPEDAIVERVYLEDYLMFLAYKTNEAERD